MVQVIDAHVHLWHYLSGPHFQWISEEMGDLKQDFVPEDLEHEMKTASVDGAIVVQAQQSATETQWLIQLAEHNPAILGVVGWTSLTSESFSTEVARLARSSKLKGIRHVLQDEQEGFMRREDFNRGITAIAGTGLVYELLIHERQLPEAVEFVRWHPKQPFVLDHLAKPKIQAGTIEPWRKNLLELAQAGDVCCKISGLVTEADWGEWTLDDLSPYLDVALDAFGPERLMAGSDWPVCLLASGYQHWWETLKLWLERLNVEERELILGKSAKRIYCL